MKNKRWRALGLVVGAVGLVVGAEEEAEGRGGHSFLGFFFIEEGGEDFGK